MSITFGGLATGIDTRLELNSSMLKSSSGEFVTATAESTAQLGSYQLSVVDLAQQQKDVSQGYADKSCGHIWYWYF